MKIKELIEKLEQKSSHQFLKAVSKPEFAFSLPKDLEFFYENYEYAILNIDTSCEIRISSLSELQPTNQILYPADDVIWEELTDDISNDWVMIASSQELSQYISIDLNEKINKIIQKIEDIKKNLSYIFKKYELNKELIIYSWANDEATSEYKISLNQMQVLSELGIELKIIHYNF